MIGKISYIFIFFLVLISSLSFAQTHVTSKQLEVKQQQLLKDLEFTKGILKDVEDDKVISISQLQTLEKQIKLRQKYIWNLNKEIKSYSSNIDETGAIILALENDLQSLKVKYAEMIKSAYKNRSSMNDLMFLFSAESFNDAYKRWRYLQQISLFRKAQAELIESTKATLSNKISGLEEKKVAKEKLLKKQQKQKNTLNKERKKKDEIIKQLQDKEKELKKQIKQKEKDVEKLNKKIKELIRKEIEAAKAKEPGGKLSAEFKANKGKLPMPVAKGFIYRGFGPHPHPVLRQVIIQNNGVDIRTKKDTRVRAIFTGEVISVFFNPGFHKAVMINHGAYFTVYSNLQEVFVKKGDKVTTYQDLGVVFNKEGESKADIHLEIWKGMTILDPSLWISSQ